MALFSKVISKVFGSQNDRVLKEIWPLVEQVNSLEPAMLKLSDQELADLTPSYKNRLANGEELDALLPEAFATVREAARRTIGQRHYDVQLIGGIALHRGSISEMKTGEGKTLAATLPVYLNALTGKGVHVVTVNDYLASRDAEWMGTIYRFLGLSVGCILHGLNDEERKAAYHSDITYGTNNEFGFDYLRDNMKFEEQELVQREFHYAIVDEVDSILIDEARTPLIISGPGDKSTGLYQQVDRVIPRLKKETHYTVDEKTRQANLTDEGIAACEKLLHVENLYDPRAIEVLHHIQQALKAHTLFKRDVDYIVKTGEVVIVDEFTGRLMPGRRYSEGLHQALEAKEKIKVQSENQTLATITFQNYFRMYDKLAGMTGTADTEAEEFHKIYKLEVVVIPTHKPMVRKDHTDVVYRSKKEKYDAVVEEIKDCYKRGQPVLVGTISIEDSELLSKRLKRSKVPHTVLNAKHHAQEAEIVSQAGQPKAVTISTNMAGRGTDIVLGEGVPELGGLHILGTERHESRRIDNQLRGRSGRQGDNGSSRFYLALDDDLLRLFGSDRLSGVISKLGMEEGEPIEHGMISKAIENAQRKVEGRNFDIRKQLLEYDDVLNQQREVIYQQRRMALTGKDLHETVIQMMEDAARDTVGIFAGDDAQKTDWDIPGLNEAVYAKFGIKYQAPDGKDVGSEAVEEDLCAKVLEAYERKSKDYGAETMHFLERMVLLQIVDSLWKDHLLNMDHLKEGIGLRGYAQKDPLREYQREGFDMFSAMVDTMRSETVSTLMRIRITRDEDLLALAPQEEVPLSFSGGEESAPAKPVKRKKAKVGRNDPCPCGSGKKYKKCCGR